MQDLPRLLYRDNFLRLGRPQTRKNVITRNASMAHLRIEKINTAPPWGGVILVIYSVKSGEKRQKILLKSTLLAVFDRTLYASYCTHPCSIRNTAGAPMLDSASRDYWLR
jgi:hypothetical protein